MIILIPGIPGVLSAEEKKLLEFTDNDSRGGWLSGELIFTVPESEDSAEKSAKISKYLLLVFIKTISIELNLDIVFY